MKNGFLKHWLNICSISQNSKRSKRFLFVLLHCSIVQSEAQFLLPKDMEKTFLPIVFEFKMLIICIVGWKVGEGTGSKATAGTVAPGYLDTCPGQENG